MRNFNIEIVAYGPGNAMLRLESEAGNGVSQAMADGVKIMACENTMRNQRLKREDMQSGLSPSALVKKLAAIIAEVFAGLGTIRDQFKFCRRSGKVDRTSNDATLSGSCVS